MTDSPSSILPLLLAGGLSVTSWCADIVIVLQFLCLGVGGVRRSHVMCTCACSPARMRRTSGTGPGTGFEPQTDNAPVHWPGIRSEPLYLAVV